MKVSKPVRLLVILIVALGLFVLAQMPSAARRSAASDAPRVVAWIGGVLPQPNVNWNS